MTLWQKWLGLFFLQETDSVRSDPLQTLRRSGCHDVRPVSSSGKIPDECSSLTADYFPPRARVQRRAARRDVRGQIGAFALNLRAGEWERLQRERVAAEAFVGVPRTAGGQRGVKSWEVQESEHGTLRGKQL